MPEQSLEISGASIVLLGSFNPPIFQPEWFARHNLIPSTLAETAKINLITPVICDFETERFHLQVTQDRFIVVSNPSAAVAGLPDLVQGTFYLLEHTPVTALGLNRQMHFSLRSEEDWHRVGDRLVPKEGWNDILEGRPGMVAVVVTAQRSDPPGSVVNVRVEPSSRIKFGVYFDVNEHYPAPTTDPLKSLIGVMRQRWEGEQTYAAEIARHVLDWANR